MRGLCLIGNRIIRKNMVLVMTSILFISIIIAPFNHPENINSNSRIQGSHSQVSSQTSDISSLDVSESELNPGMYIIPYDSQLQTGSIFSRYNLHTIPYSIINLQSPTTIQTFEGKIYDITNSQFILDTTLQLPDTQFDLDAYSDDINVGPVWSQGINGTAVVVAVVDTGINFLHPALQGKKYDEKSFHLKQFGYDEDLGPSDNQGHGTAVAGLVAGYDPGTFKGAAFGAKIVNAKIGFRPSDGLITSSSVLAAMDWAISLPDVDVITFSLGETEDGAAQDVFEELLNTAVKNGKIITGSAGNRNNAFTIKSPGSSAEVITAGATKTGTNTITSFSSEGPTFAYESKPDILTPGEYVTTTHVGGGYTNLAGTSFSTPILAGSVATLLSGARATDISDITPGFIKSSVLQGATDLGYSSYKQGHGKLNVSASWDIIKQISQNDEHHLTAISPEKGDFFRLKVPINHPNTFVVSLISTKKAPWLIEGHGENFYQLFSLASKIRYSGYTSIYEIKIAAKPTSTLGSYDLTLNFTNSLSTLFNFSIEIIEEPEMTLLLDLSHTIYDLPLTDFKARDRIFGIDLSTMVSIFAANGIWIDEFYTGNLVIDTLSVYDGVWMPSAFTNISPAPYDHEYDNNTQLSRKDVFALYEYLQSGGSLLIDLERSQSISLDSGDHETDMFIESLVALSNLLDLNVSDKLETYSTQSSLTPNSYSPFPSIDVSTGYYEFMEGIPIIQGQEGFAGIADFYGKGKIFAMNSREWRDQSVASQVDIQQFISAIASWLSKDGVIRSIDQDYQDDSFLLNLGIDKTQANLTSMEIILEINGDETSYEIVTDLSNDIQSLKFQANHGDFLHLELHSDAINFTYYDTLELREFIPDGYDVNIETDHVIDLFFTLPHALKLDSSITVGAFDSGNLLTSSTSYILNPKGVVGEDGKDVLQVRLFSSETSLTYTKLTSGDIEFSIISNHGIKSDFNFDDITGSNGIVTSSPNSNTFDWISTKEKARNFIIVLITTQIIVLIIVKRLRMKRRY